MSNKMDEIIIVVPRKALFNFGQLDFEGTESDPEKVAKLNRNIEQNLGVMRRGDAEENTSFKQPIPYAVIRRGKEIFLYKRLVGGGETRLHDKLSIGVGGHMNLDSADWQESLASNLGRELEEELDILEAADAERKVSTIGFINSEEDAVNQVHIGILVMIDLYDGAVVSVREKDQLEGEFVTLASLQDPAVYSRLEPWSKIAVDTLSK